MTRLLPCNWTANVGTGVTGQKSKLGMPSFEPRNTCLYLSFPLRGFPALTLQKIAISLSTLSTDNEPSYRKSFCRKVQKAHESQASLVTERSATPESSGVQYMSREADKM